MPQLDRYRGKCQHRPVKDDATEEKKKTGRGLLAIVGAKVWFILTGFAIKFSLPHLLGSPAEFGFYETAMSAVSMLNMVLIASTIQTVSKFVSESEDDAPALLRQGLLVQCIVGGLIALGAFAAAPFLAGFLKDDALVPLLRVATIVIIAYALYASIVGSLNGRRAFVPQARLDATFSLLRSTGIIGGAALGLGALGAISGFAAAATAILLIAFVAVRSDLKSKAGTRIPWKKWLSFMAPIWIYQLALNGCFQIDGLVLKRAVAGLASDEGVGAVEAAQLASTQVGFYRAAQTFAFVPYQLILALTFVVFPLVSKATTLGDEEAARSAVRGAMRFSFLVLLALAAPIAGAARGALRIAYPAEYVVPGAPALTILALAMVAFALFVITATILSGMGHPGLAAGIAGVSLVVIVLAGTYMVRQAGAGPEALPALATATAMGTSLAFLLSSAVLYRRFGGLIPVATLVRGALAACVAGAVAHALPQDSRLMGLTALVVGGLSYLAVLAITRELTKADVELVTKLRR